MTETECQFCGQKHGVRCPSVKAIEYHEDGKVRRVEFMTAVDYHPLQFQPNPAGIPAYWPSSQQQNPNRVL